MKPRPLATRMWAVMLVLLLTQPAWLHAVTTGPELPNPGSTSITKEQQEQMGLKAVAEVYKQMPVLPDSNPVTQYVQQLGRKLETVIPQQYSWPYQFHVIQQKEINAFALPGGPIFINVGTITAADNEAELAGVMAHEMSHVYMQHSAKAAPKQEWANVLGALGGLLGGGAVGSLARLGIQIGAGGLLLKYSRGDEAQADAVGAIIMYKAGYNPRAMAEFFEKLEKQSGPGGPQFLSDHPNPGNRVAAVDKEIADWPPRNYLGTSQAFERAKQQAAGVKAYTAEQIGEGAKQGIWARQNAQTGAMPHNLPATASTTAAAAGQLANVSYSQVQPSDNFTLLQRNAFSISYPDNWQVHSDAETGLAIVPPAGVAEGSIAYGVIVSAAVDRSATTLDQATQDLMRNLEQSNPGLRSAGNPQRIRVNGVEGRSVDLVGVSPVQQNGTSERERDWLVTLPRPQGGLLYLVFIAPENDFSRLRPTYEKMLNSVQMS